MEDNVISAADNVNDQPGNVGNKNSDSVSRSIAAWERDFQNTNQHTKQTGDRPVNDETENSDEKDGAESAGVNTEASKKTNLAKLVKGKNAVKLVDMVVPAILIFIIGLFGYEIGEENLKLDKDERDTLEPFVTDFLDNVNIDFNNPYVNLSIGLGIVYGSKLLPALRDMKKRKDIKPPATVEEKIREISQSKELTDAEKFEDAYNLIVIETNQRRKKGPTESKKWLAMNEPTRLNTLMDKYNIVNREPYLNPQK